MQTISIICVGVDNNGILYSTKCIDNVKRLVNEFGFDVRILTDTPKDFEDIICTTYEYDKKIFSYFVKYFFSFKLIKELNKSVTYIDCDSIDILIKNEKYRTLESEDEVLFLTFWPVKINDEWMSWKFLPDMNIDKWVRPIIEFIELEGSDPSKIETMFEQLYYFPIGLDYDKIQYELEKIKPVFEYASLYSKNLYRRTVYGHGEGLALSYSLYINNVKKRKIENPLTFEEGYNYISRTKLKKN